MANPYNNPGYDPSDPSTWFNVDANGQPVAAPPAPPPAPAVVDPNAPKTGNGVNDIPGFLRTGRQTTEGIPSGSGKVDPDMSGASRPEGTGGFGGTVSGAVRGTANYPVQFVKDALGDLGITGGPDDHYQQQIDLAIGQTAPSNANAQTAFSRALEESARASGYQGPADIATPTIAAPERLDRANYWDTSNTTAQSVDATGNMQRAYAVDAAPVQRARVDGVDTNILAPTMGPAAQTERVKVASVKGDPLAESIRAEQVKAALGIASGPSAAKATMAAGQANSLADALAMASTARGDARTGALREAILANTQQGLAASLSASALAAKEEQDKRAASAAALAGVRSADVSSSGQKMAIDAQLATTQAQIDQAIASGNTAAVNELTKQKATLELSARQAQVQAGLEQQKTTADVAKANMGVDATLSQANQAATNKAASDFAAQRNAAAESAAARQTSTNLANAALGQAQSAANVNRALTGDTQNAANTQATRTQNAANTIAVGGQNAQNEIEAEKVRTGATTAGITAGVNAANTQATNAGTVVDANKAASDAAAKENASIIGAAGAGIAAIASDERVKDDIKEVPQSEIDELARAMITSARPVTFRYKPGVEDGGENEQVGELAQALERSALGRKLVTKDDDGIRAVNYGGLAALAPALALAAVRASRKEAR